MPAGRPAGNFCLPLSLHLCTCPNNTCNAHTHPSTAYKWTRRRYAEKFSPAFVGLDPNILFPPFFGGEGGGNPPKTARFCSVVPKRTTTQRR